MKPVLINAEGVNIPLRPTDWKENHGVTLCCAILNEEENLSEFIDWHSPFVDHIVVIDGGSSDGSFLTACKKTDHVKILKFAGHYGNQKNRAIEMSLTDWTLFLDPDERLSKDALTDLRKFIDQDEVDSYSFPRRNFVNDIQDMSHGADHQSRLFRSYCRYIRPVHEELVGFKNRTVFPDESNYEIIHRKKKSRHESRNGLYKAYELLFVRELGAPGSQMETSFNSRFQNVVTSVKDLKGIK